MASVADIVKRGAGLLDERRPGWDREIDISELDIALGRSCILGQLYGQYGVGVHELKVTGAYYGFAATWDVDASKCITAFDLTAAWQEELASRAQIEAPRELVAV